MLSWWNVNGFDDVGLVSGSFLLNIYSSKCYGLFGF